MRNYYNEFEGEPEIKILDQAKRDLLKIWGGYFDAICQQIMPAESGWTDLAYYYHMDEGWNEVSPWKIPNIQGVYNQLKQINGRSLQPPCDEILESILMILERAIKEGEEVWIAYE